MPIREIKCYATLRAVGETTLNERLEMLLQHRHALSQQITQLQVHQTKLDDKIEYYQEEIAKNRKRIPNIVDMKN